MHIKPLNDDLIFHLCNRCKLQPSHSLVWLTRTDQVLHKRCVNTRGPFTPKHGPPARGSRTQQPAAALRAHTPGQHVCTYRKGLSSTHRGAPVPSVPIGFHNSFALPAARGVGGPLQKLCPAEYGRPLWSDCSVPQKPQVETLPPV